MSVPERSTAVGGVDGASALRRELREAAVESRWEAAPAVVLVILPTGALRSHDGRSS
jgi:hypothetical protein